MQTKYSERIRISYLPFSSPKVTLTKNQWGWIDYPADTVRCTIYRPVGDDRPVVELLAEQLNTDSNALQILHSEVERVLETYDNVVRVSAYRILKDDATDIDKQRLQFSRKAFEVAIIEENVVGGYYRTYGYVVGKDTAIYRFSDILNEGLTVNYEGSRTRKLTVCGYIQVPEGPSIRSSVESAVDRAFDEYCDKLRKSMVVLEQNKGNWTRKD